MSRAITAAAPAPPPQRDLRACGQRNWHPCQSDPHYPGTPRFLNWFHPAPTFTGFCSNDPSIPETQDPTHPVPRDFQLKLSRCQWKFLQQNFDFRLPHYRQVIPRGRISGWSDLVTQRGFMPVAADFRVSSVGFAKGTPCGANATLSRGGLKAETLTHSRSGLAISDEDCLARLCFDMG